MSKVSKKLPNKILVHMKTFNKTYIRVLDHLLGVEKHLSVFFPISLYLPAAYVYKNRKKAQTFTKSAVYGLGLFSSRPQGFLPSGKAKLF